MSTDIDIISERVTLQELNTKIQDPTDFTLLIDVRTPKEFAAGHIPGFVNYPLDYLASEVSNFVDKDIIISCLSGNRTTKAAEIIHELSTPKSITEFSGGFNEWEAAGMPIESDVTTTQPHTREYHPELESHKIADPDHAINKVKTNFTKAAGVAGTVSHQVFEQAKDTIGGLENKFVSLPPLRQVYFLLGMLMLLSAVISGVPGVILALFVGLALIFSAVSGIMFMTDWMGKAPWNRKR